MADNVVGRLPRQSYFKPILALVGLSTILPELLSGNLPAQILLQPHILIILVIVGYGFPILVIREVAVRAQLGIMGIFILGLVYGIYNEGILAKTFLLETGVPVPTFDHYSYFAGVNLGFSILISTWHALHAVLYPILLTYFTFPAAAGRPWLGKKTTALLAIPGLVMGTIGFFRVSDNGARGTVPLFALFIVCMIVLLLLALRFKGKALKTVPRASLKPVFFGFSFMAAHIIVSLVLSRAGTPILVFLVYQVAIFILYAWVLARHNWLNIPNLLLFGLGHYLGTGIIGLFGGFQKGGIIGSLVVFAALLTLVKCIFKIKKKYNLANI